MNSVGIHLIILNQSMKYFICSKEIISLKSNYPKNDFTVKIAWSVICNVFHSYGDIKEIANSLSREYFPYVLSFEYQDIIISAYIINVLFISGNHII